MKIYILVSKFEPNGGWQLVAGYFNEQNANAEVVKEPPKGKSFSIVTLDVLDRPSNG